MSESFLIGEGEHLEIQIDAAGTETYEPPPPVTGNAQTRVGAFAQYLNMHRNSIGRAPLQEDELIRRIAQAFVNRFIVPFEWEGQQLQGFFGHGDPAGERSTHRFLAAGVPLPYGGENIGWFGMSEPPSHLEGYLGSSGHRLNIEKAVYTHHGIGYVLGSAGLYLNTKNYPQEPAYVQYINAPGWFQVNLFWGPNT